jgi:hypothetical protein
MFRQSPIKQSSKLLLNSPLLQNIVADLDPRHEESLSGGDNLFIILLATPGGGSVNEIRLHDRLGTKK